MYNVQHSVSRTSVIIRFMAESWTRNLPNKKQEHQLCRDVSYVLLQVAIVSIASTCRVDEYGRYTVFERSVTAHKTVTTRNQSRDLIQMVTDLLVAAARAVKDTSVYKSCSLARKLHHHLTLQSLFARLRRTFAVFLFPLKRDQAL
jgi:hypothetical protein